MKPAPQRLYPLQSGRRRSVWVVMVVVMLVMGLIFRVIDLKEFQ